MYLAVKGGALPEGERSPPSPGDGLRRRLRQGGHLQGAAAEGRHPGVVDQELGSAVGVLNGEPEGGGGGNDVFGTERQFYDGVHFQLSALEGCCKNTYLLFWGGKP